VTASPHEAEREANGDLPRAQRPSTAPQRPGRTGPLRPMLTDEASCPNYVLSRGPPSTSKSVPLATAASAARCSADGRSSEEPPNTEPTNGPAAVPAHPRAGARWSFMPGRREGRSSRPQPQQARALAFLPCPPSPAAEPDDELRRKEVPTLRHMANADQGQSKEMARLRQVQPPNRDAAAASDEQR